MHDPYEAAAVGTALFAFGSAYAAAYAERHPGPSVGGVAIAGFAQSPLDELLGDLRFGVHGRHALVEFKRTVRGIATELEKPRRVALLRAAQADTARGARIRALGARGHFLGYGAVSIPPSARSRPQPTTAGPSAAAPAAADVMFGRYLPLVLGVDRGQSPATVSSLSGLGEFAHALVRGDGATANPAMPGFVGTRVPDAGPDDVLDDVPRVERRVRPIRVAAAPSCVTHYQELAPLAPGLSLAEILEYQAFVLDPVGDGTSDGAATIQTPGYWLSVSADGALACAAYGNDAHLMRLEALAAHAIGRTTPPRQPSVVSGGAAASAPVPPRRPGPSIGGP